MRKRNIVVLLLTVLLLTALLLAGLTGCARRGDTSGVEIVVGASEQFSDEDIRGAMDAAMRAFHRGHSGCAMVRLAYNEAYRTCWLAGWRGRAGRRQHDRAACERVCARPGAAQRPDRRRDLYRLALRARAARQRLARGQQRLLKM